MGYYIRVLGTSTANISLEQLKTSARPAVIEADGEGGAEWQIILKHAGGAEIAMVERNPVVEGELGAEELEEFMEEVELHQPESAAHWLKEYLPRVKVIYAFQLLGGTDVNDGRSHLDRVYKTVWRVAGGILQADQEGFSNEEGYTILWQFGESAKGPWKVGVLANGGWVHFEIDLGNSQHREAFQHGKVPEGVKLLD